MGDLPGSPGAASTFGPRSPPCFFIFYFFFHDSRKPREAAPGTPRPGQGFSRKSLAPPDSPRETLDSRASRQSRGDSRLAPVKPSTRPRTESKPSTPGRVRAGGGRREAGGGSPEPPRPAPRESRFAPRKPSTRPRTESKSPGRGNRTQEKKTQPPARPNNNKKKKKQTNGPAARRRRAGRPSTRLKTLFFKKQKTNGGEGGEKKKTKTKLKELGTKPNRNESQNPEAGNKANTRRGAGQIVGTGGRISVDRSSKATLPLTIPRPIFKSSAEDSSPRSSEIAMQSTRAQLLPPARGGSRHMLLGAHGAPLLVVGLQPRR